MFKHKTLLVMVITIVWAMTAHAIEYPVYSSSSKRTISNTQTTTNQKLPAPSYQMRNVGVYPTGSAPANGAAGGPRRAPIYGPEDDGNTEKDYKGEHWIFDEDSWEWIHAPGTVVGQTYTDPDDGTVYIWNGYAWEASDLSQPGTPVGAMPWMLMLLLCGGYAAAAAYRRREA